MLSANVREDQHTAYYLLFMHNRALAAVAVAQEPGWLRWNMKAVGA